MMYLAALLIVLVCVLVAVAIMRARARRETEEKHTITAESLHALLASKQDVLLYDVRLPLDVLAYSEIIPGAKRLPPKEVLENPSLISKEKDSVVYCTCPSDKTSRAVVDRALAMHLTRIKVLKGGLEAWKKAGYPVEPYDKPFHLDTGT